ncbi:MAG: nitroreductase family protein [Bacteroidales bacterium]|jgi:predicted oxidoreductase (fatty acid repression mutant protein)|nr:nitroreductase family protein [Bacteroidales bacterium]
MKTFEEAIKQRRSHYALSNRSPVPDSQIQEIIDTVVTNMPSAFNSQTTRVVLLLDKQHQTLWNIVKDTLRKHISPEAYAKTQEKVDKSFASGYGTILFFEDQLTVQQLQAKFPSYAANFPVWSQQTSAIHQFSIWVMLEEAGFGASLQHYNPIIDDEVKATWKLPDNWQLISQMPFGVSLETPGDKTSLPLEERVCVFR